MHLDVNTSGILLNIHTMISLGLIINECSTNALKHAFLGRDEGYIIVRLKKNDVRYEMVFTDDGC